MAGRSRWSEGTGHDDDSCPHPLIHASTSRSDLHLRPGQSAFSSGQVLLLLVLFSVRALKSPSGRVHVSLQIRVMAVFWLFTQHIIHMDPHNPHY